MQMRTALSFRRNFSKGKTTSASWAKWCIITRIASATSTTRFKVRVLCVFAAFCVLPPKLSLRSGLNFACVSSGFRVGFVCVPGDTGLLDEFCALPKAIYFLYIARIWRWQSPFNRLRHHLQPKLLLDVARKIVQGPAQPMSIVSQNSPPLRHSGWLPPVCAMQ